MKTTRLSPERARLVHLDLARHCAKSSDHPGAMRQIVRRLRELDTPENEIQDATGMTAIQIDVLMTRSVPSTPSADATAKALLTVGEAYQQRRRVDAQIDAAVLGARGAGASWEMVGAMLGISRQAAQERFGKGERRAS